jgi:tetraacyldisaccharide 4'-kinase
LSRSSEQYLLDVISGRQRGPAASGMRAVLTAGELCFAAVSRCRNFLYDRRLLPIHSLGRPTVSIGNLTTGGTGKTPVVCWLAAAAQAAGRNPVVLLRGYKSRGGLSDEQLLISEAVPAIGVVANPDRRAGAAEALAKNPLTDLFILDDGMQHRRARRDLEIVLISAIDPWSNGHLLPRGLLRESLAGLRRADALVITHANLSSPEQSTRIQRIVKKYHPTCLIVHAEHTITNLIAGDESNHPSGELAQRKYYIACAIGQPEGFVASLSHRGTESVGQQFFPDHHSYTQQDVEMIRQNAAAAEASIIVVTEKDWTKLKSLPNIQSGPIRFWRAKMSLTFRDDGERQLLDLVLSRTRP